MRSRAGLLVVGLPLLPVLALPDIQARAPVLALALVVAAAGLVAGGVWGVRQYRARLSGNAAGVPHDAEPAPRSTSARAGGPARGRARRFDPGLIAVLVLAGGYALFMSLLTVGRHNSFDTHAFDLGIQAQAMWSLVRHGVPWTTLYGAQAVNQFGDHFSPIYYLLVPLYAARPDARTLLVFQSVWLAAGAVPVYLLARRRLASLAAAIAVAACYLLFPGLHAVNQLDFHEIALATPLLLWALYAVDRDRYGLAAVFLALALLAKEEVALTGIAIGAYVMLVKGRLRTGLAIALASLAYFVLVAWVVMPALGGGPDVGRFTGMAAPPAAGFAAVVLTLFTNPIFTFSYALLDPQKAFFLAQLLVPLLALPLVAGLGGWIIAAPGLATLLLSSYRNQYSLDAHYPAIVIPSLFYLTVLGLARIRRRSAVAIPALAAALLAAGLLMNQQYGLLWGKGFAGFPAQSPHDRVAAKLIAQIPPAASVATYSDFVPHLANRDRIYLLPDVTGEEYILFDTAPGTDYFPLISRDPRGEAVGRMYPNLASGAYGVVAVEDGLMLLQQGHDTGENEAALAALGTVTYDAAALPGAESSTNRPDGDARSGAARVSPAGAPTGSPEAVRPVFGPYATLIPGRYRVEFRLKAGSEAAGPVAVLDVFSFAAGGVVGQQEVAAEQFATPDAYQSFGLDIRTDKLLQDVEFRVAHTGGAPLSIDTISVIYQGPP